MPVPIPSNTLSLLNNNLKAYDIDQPDLKLSCQFPRFFLTWALVQYEMMCAMKLFIRFNDIILRTQPTLRFGKLFWAKMGSWPERMLVQYNNTLDKFSTKKSLKKRNFLYSCLRNWWFRIYCITFRIHSISISILVWKWISRVFLFAYLKYVEFQMPQLSKMVLDKLQTPFFSFFN